MFSIRKIGILSRTYRHLNRYRQILAVLFKYGFGDIIELLKIEQYIEIGLQMISKKRRARLEKLTRAQRARMVLEELGPTYVKLGQMLSTRPDLIPKDFAQELTKLQDEVPPFLFAEATPIFEKELGKSPHDIFESIDEIPFASASIAQVHKAQLPNGEEVAVKIQRPGIRKTIEVDLEIMLHLATLMEHHVEELSLHRPVKIVEEFARSIAKEVDFRTEASNIERFASNFLKDATIYIPKVFRQVSTSRILSMEYVQGVKVSCIDKLEASGLDRKLIVTRGANLLLKQIFEHGFFHADPHPGNIFVLPNNVICLLDFGMMGTVDLRTREEFVELLDGIVHQDQPKTTHALLQITTWQEEPDLRALDREVADFLGRHLYKSLAEIELGEMLHSFFYLVARHRLQIPPEIFMMIRALSILEGVGRGLDPDFDIIAQAKPFLEKVKLARIRPERVKRDFMRFSGDLMSFIQQFPRDLLELGRLLRQKQLAVNLEHQGLDVVISAMHQIINRLSFAVIIAALIIGSAIIVNSKIPPLLFGISLIGILVFVSAAVMGFWLLVAIIRKGKL
jgi:ubiquinone biosynthesis protein